MLNSGVLNLTLKSSPVPNTPVTVESLDVWTDLPALPDTAPDTVWDTSGCIWDTTWDTMLDWEEGLVEEEEEIVEVDPEEDAPDKAEDTVWVISGCSWAKIVAIKSVWEVDEDPLEEVDDEDDDPDPDICCPVTADETVWEIRGCICDTTAETMSDCRFDPSEEEEVLDEIPNEELPEEESKEELEEISDNELPDDVPNRLDESPDDELPDDDKLDPGRITVTVDVWGLDGLDDAEELVTWVLTGFAVISTNPSCTSLSSEYPIGPAI